MGAVESLFLAASGTAMLAGLAWLMGFGRIRPLAGPDEVQAQVEGWLPGLSVEAVALSVDRLAALVRVPGHALMLVVATGDRASVGTVPQERVTRHTASLLEFAPGGLGQPRRVFGFDPDALSAVLGEPVPASGQLDDANRKPMLDSLAG